ncbi:hypothetical protein H1P_570006 [Hyella patelloides LEGE 07179]|uniref:Uncharacterized protein n=1 Tax=Hyella patelloides LEGE 07179 TaxID=945734 RepID=A0A563W0K3_9CYAN|nr:hypothetical protein H1P_570006 [Hyella patelloides LEGE 07179]
MMTFNRKPCKNYVLEIENDSRGEYIDVSPSDLS